MDIGYSRRLASRFFAAALERGMMATLISLMLLVGATATGESAQRLSQMHIAASDAA